MSRFQPGQSGNPAGRPPGSSNTLHQRLRDAVGARFDELVRSVLDAAISGDMAAAALILNRVVPTIRPMQEPQPFALAGDSMTAKAHAILDAVGRGELSAADGKSLLDAVGGVVKVQDAEQTQKQLELIRLSLDASHRKAA